MATEPATGEVTDKKTPEPEANSSDGRDLVLKILGAIGTGVGILGFVTLFGGAILWIRADQAGLPANDAVSAIPNSVLVTTGASFLVPAVLLASLAVAFIFVVHLGFGLWRRVRKDNRFKEARELRRKADEEAREAEAKIQLALAARTLATSLSDAADLAQKDATASPEMKARLEKDAEEQRQKAEQEEALALEMTGVAADKRAKAENLQTASESALSSEQFGAELVVGGLVLLFVPPILNGAISNAGLGEFLALAGVALGTVAVSLAIYASTEKFIWFGVVAFVTVGIYIGFATYFSTTGNPKVEPAVALRSDHPPVIGVYVADTASNLYLGTFPGTGQPSRLLVIPRAQVTDLAIGPLLDRGAARNRALSLAEDACEQQILVAKTETEPASTKPACSKDQLATLSASATGWSEEG